MGRRRIKYGGFIHKYLEVILLLGVLSMAALAVVIRPFAQIDVAYFSDVATPLVIIVGILLLIMGKKRRGV